MADWDHALRAAISQAPDGRLIVIDELPFLLGKSPELESVIQRLHDEASAGLLPPFRLLVCGSALSVMGRILAGARPLRGRAVLDLRLRSFDFRTAAAFWGIRDPRMALLVDAVVGGTPGYRDLMPDPPTSPDHLVDWLGATVLDPAHALFTEDAWLLTEDPAITDRALYQSVLSAIAAGRHTQREIGGVLGRPDQALAHPLRVLEGAGLIRRDQDVLLARRPLLRIADPMLRFQHVVVRPERVRLESRLVRDAWATGGRRFETGVVGPHFEELAREWCRRFASSRTLGGHAGTVGFTAVNDAAARERYEIDVAVLDAEAPAGEPRLLALGEAKASSTAVGVDVLHRLERLRGLIARGQSGSARLLIFSRAGFDRGLRAEARGRSDLELVDLDRLYGGD